MTGALAVPEQAPFLGAGFSVEERLDVLSIDLEDVTGEPRRIAGLLIRRARGTDRREVLVVDHLAFDHFWQLDEIGLADALDATPRTRFRVAVGGSTESTSAPVVGYMITGRAASNGFLQRVAVHPTWQRRGVGRALVLDGLVWLKKRGVERAVVNTQPANGKALALYESIGFRREPRGLSVLSAGVRP